MMVIFDFVWMLILILCFRHSISSPSFQLRLHSHFLRCLSFQFLSLFFFFCCCCWSFSAQISSVFWALLSWSILFQYFLVCWAVLLVYKVDLLLPPLCSLYTCEFISLCKLLHFHLRFQEEKVKINIKFYSAFSV
jgi:hypothetical protein